MSSQAYYELYRGSRYSHTIPCIRHIHPQLKLSWEVVESRLMLTCLTNCLCDNSLGLSLTDTLDDLINEGRIEPQLAMKILSNFDRYVTEILAMQVRARLTFKVCLLPLYHSNLGGG